MGREAVVNAEAGAEAGEVKALLETRELILRGALRRRYSKEALEGVRVEGDTLSFTVAGEAVRLHLGPKGRRGLGEGDRHPAAEPARQARTRQGRQGIPDRELR
jgi:hypothetical protein